MSHYRGEFVLSSDIVIAAPQIPARRNLTIWNSAVYCAQVACDALIVALC
jgi:hypothetical protein